MTIQQADLAELTVRRLGRCATCGTLHPTDDAVGTCPRCGKPSPPMTEHELVEALYQAHAVPLLRFVRNLATRRGLSESLLDAEGVVHEAFTAILRSREIIENPKGWLFTVARRVVGRASALRRLVDTAPEDQLDAGAVLWSTLSAQPSAEDVYAARQVLTELATLTSRQKVAVYLRHVQGWPTAEIADYLGCAPSTVSVHIHRGMASLRRRLSEYFVLLVAAIGVGGLSLGAFTGGGTMPPLTPMPPTNQFPAGDIAGPLSGLPVIVALIMLGVGVLMLACLSKPRWRAILDRRQNSDA